MRSFLFLLLFLSLLSPLQARTRLDARMEYFPPYLLRPDGKDPGYAVELLRAVVPKDKYDLSIRWHSWGDSLANLHRGWYDAVIGAAHGDVSARFSAEPLFRVRCAVFVRKDSALRYKDLSSLLKFKTAMRSDWSVNDELDRYRKEHASDGKVLVRSGNDASDRNLQSLLKGEVHFLIENEETVRWTLRRWRRKDDSVQVLFRFPETVNFHLVFRWGKEYETACRDFNESLKKFRKTPQYKALREKYGLCPE